MARTQINKNDRSSLNRKDLTDTFKKVLNNNNSCRELVSMIEKRSDLLPDYCKSYVIALVSDYCDDKYDAELFLAVCKLTKGSNPASKKQAAILEYYEQAKGYSPRLDPSWVNSSVVRKVSDTLDEITAKLVEAIIQKGGKMEVAEKASENLVLYVPLYMKTNTASDIVRKQISDDKAQIKPENDAQLIHSQSGTSIPPLCIPDWGDSSRSGKRPCYTLAQVNGGILGDRIVFNSITDSVIGNERRFVGVRVDNGVHAGPENEYWNWGYIPVKNHEVYIIRCYIHNNNPNGIYATAKNVRVAFDVPTESAKEIQVKGIITSSNATPDKYWAAVVFKNNTPFRLQYIEGSALLENNGIASKGSTFTNKLSDNIVNASSDGVLVNYNTLDGSLPGCYQYANYATIRVEAIFDEDIVVAGFTIEQKVRLAGTSEWKTNVVASVGDKVEFQVEYKNISEEDQRHTDVMIKDIIANNLRYIPGSTVLYNGSFPDGDRQDDDILTDLNIHNYQKGANAFVRFTAEVVDRSLKCGSNTIVNWIQGRVGHKTIQDYATVMVYKTE